MPATRLGHVLVLLEFLARNQGHWQEPEVIAERLRGSYDRPSSDPTFLRQLDRDLLPLVLRGVERRPGRRAYRLRIQDKSESLHLEPSEHLALQEIWADPHAPIPPTLPSPHDQEFDRLERALGVLRILEEQCGGYIAVDELARRTGIRRREIETALKDLEDVVDMAGASAPPFRLDWADDKVSCDPVRSDRLPRNRGPLGRLGLFGYSATELTHRLALIDYGLQKHPNKQELLSAEAKLRKWQAIRSRR